MMRETRPCGELCNRTLQQILEFQVMAEELRPHVLWISLLLVTAAVPPVKVVTTANISSNNKPHSRQKRLLWLTTDGRLALPPSTTLSINPTLSLPFVRQPPDGFSSSLSVSLPFTSK